MKVIYEETILEKIEKAKVEAANLGKKIVRIEVNKEEFDELYKLMEPVCRYGVTYTFRLEDAAYPTLGRVKYDGITIQEVI